MNEVETPNPGNRRTESKGSAHIPYALSTAAEWAWRIIIVAIASYAFYWALSKISLVIISLAIAILLTCLIYPVVAFLRQHKVLPGIATAIAELGLIAVVILLLMLVGQQLTSGFSSLSDQVSQGYNQLMALLQNLPFDVGADQLDSYISQFGSWLQENSSAVISGVASVGSRAADFGTGMIICLFALIFFLLEGERIWLFVVNLFPRAARQPINGAGRRGWRSLTSYVHVQVFVAFIDAVGIGLSAFFLGVPLAIPVAVLVFLGSFIPIVGAVVTGAVAVLLALVANGLVNALLMLLMVLVVQQIESNILQPLVMGKAVSLHPLAVFLAVAMGSLLYGIVGALFAVPLMAVLNTVIRYLAGREWETDSSIRTTPFYFPHEIERKKKKDVSEKVKERLEALKKSEKKKNVSSIGI
ncbi:AI-2E family transporter [uncultured Rothia sp.]|uniref:AI-2E family transporter n=1 Tax=uncultured Rothia sp. TaxID=316088 RepID=UPI003216E371